MLIFLHIFAAMAGVVLVTGRTAVFFKSGKLSSFFQKAVWGSLGVLMVTGVGLLLTDPSNLHRPAFWVKMLFLGGVLGSESYLSRSRSGWAAFAAVFTWYFTFLLSFFSRLGVGHFETIVLYFMILGSSWTVYRFGLLPLKSRI